MRVLGISGSLRRDSYNTKLLRAAEELLPPFFELQVWDELKAVPPFDEDDELAPEPAAVASLREAVRQADAVLFATPEYNASIPGQLKNAVLKSLMKPLGYLAALIAVLVFFSIKLLPKYEANRPRLTLRSIQEATRASSSPPYLRA